MTNIKNEINGWLIINKPLQIGSTQVVGKIKHLLHPRKIGHAGTLDPLATGVLPIALGKATRLIPFVMDGVKQYEFDIRWGTETDSDDLAGNIVSQSEKRPKQTEIIRILPQFIGNIQQKPNPYSAIKINGKRAYDLIRAGQEVSIPLRWIRVDSLKLLKNTHDTASFIATVSKGTYIRTLAHDIAHALGTVGVVSRLHRTMDGPFDIQNAIDMDSDLSSHILPIETVLNQIPVLTVTEIIAGRICYGQRIKGTEYQNLSGLYVIRDATQIRALVEIQDGVIHPRLVF